MLPDDGAKAYINAAQNAVRIVHGQVRGIRIGKEAEVHAGRN